MKDAQKRTKNAPREPGGVLFSAQSSLLGAGTAAATLASASATMPSALSSFTPLSCDDRFLLIGEDVVDGALSSFTDRLHGGSGISVSSCLSAVGSGLLKD